MRIEALIDHANIGDYQGLQPAFGAQAEKRILARAVGMASIANGGEQLLEEYPVAFFEHALFGAHAEDDLLFAAEGFGFGTYAGAGKLQATPAEGEFRGGKNSDFAVGKNGPDSGN